jgi:hypothetical protein
MEKTVLVTLIAFLLLSPIVSASCNNPHGVINISAGQATATPSLSGWECTGDFLAKDVILVDLLPNIFWSQNDSAFGEVNGMPIMYVNVSITDPESSISRYQLEYTYSPNGPVGTLSLYNETALSFGDGISSTVILPSNYSIAYTFIAGTANLDGTYFANVTFVGYTIDYRAEGSYAPGYFALYRVGGVLQHDVAITDVVPSQNCTYQGFIINVNVTTANLGNFTENVTVNVYYNGVVGEGMIGTETVALNSGQTDTLTFTWDTTSVKPCYSGYSIAATADIYPWIDSNMTNNILQSPFTVQVRIIGDLNGDGKIDIEDISDVARAFGTVPGDPRWNPYADVNRDGRIDGMDLVMVAKSFGKSYTVAVIRPQVSTSWNPVEDSYGETNYGSVWSEGGNCYGLSSTAILYFMNYKLGNSDYPCFPAQSPPATSTSGLTLPADMTVLNNASLAVMFHQEYDPNNNFIDSPLESVEFDKLIGTLESGIPALLLMGGVDSSGQPAYHAAVAYAIQPLQDGPVNILLSDPNSPQQSETANYNPITQTFSYDAGGFSFNEFEIGTPRVIQASWFAPSYIHTVSWPAAGYTIVLADKPVEIVSERGFMDYFNKTGDSGSLVCGISGSAGFEEGEIQVYAIPSNIQSYVVDPSANQSAVTVTHVENTSVRLTSSTYLSDLTEMQKPLNFTVNSSDFSFSTKAAVDLLNTSVTFFSPLIKAILSSKLQTGESMHHTRPISPLLV